MDNPARAKKLDLLLHEVRACTVCTRHLPLGPRPVLRASATAKIVIIGQAPGRKVHETGIPWNDPSGDLLRERLGVAKETCYDEARSAADETVLNLAGGKTEMLTLTGQPPLRESFTRLLVGFFRRTRTKRPGPSSSMEKHHLVPWIWAGPRGVWDRRLIS